MYLNLLNVDHEDVVCRLFPCTFESKPSTWNFSLLAQSITNWDYFEKDLLSKFGEERTVSSLMRELLSLKMDKKGKIKYFKQ